MRIALGVEYDGRRFKGWQIQRHAVRTVQAELEAAIAVVASEVVRTTCAGRTDTGVHATGQVVHFDTQVEREPRNWILGTNVNLPSDVAVSWARVVMDGFHARFSAVGRRYSYLILNRPTRSSLFHGRATWIHQPLDAERMQSAANALLGTHDFSSYRAQGCQAKSPVRTVYAIDVTRSGEQVWINIHANAFLHHMVRNIAGVLIAIGKADRPVSWTAEVLEHRDRSLGGVTAPPDGLYLSAVDYPEDFAIPAPPPLPFA